MKSQRSQYLFVFLSLFLFLIGSCVNDLDTELSGPVPASGKMGVTQAKSFFDSSGGKVAFPVMGLPSQGVQNKSLTSVVSPQWDSYRQINADSYQAIQVPLDDGNHYAARTYSLDSLGRATMEKSSWQSYLVVARIGQKNRMRSFVVTLIPSRDYHERKSGWKSVINFSPEGSDFTGMVLYSSLEGQFYSGTTFREGRVVGRIQSEQCDSTQCAGDGSCEGCHKPSVGLKHLVLCLYGPEDLVLNRAICPETGNEYPDDQICPTCGYKHVIFEVVEVFATPSGPTVVVFCGGCLANLTAGEPCQCCLLCWSPPGEHEQWCMFYEGEGDLDDLDGDGGDGGDDGGYEGGGDGHIPSWTPQGVAPYASSIFNTTLTKTQWEKLESLVFDMKKSPLGNTLYNALSARVATSGTKFDFSFGSENRFYYESNSISLKENAISSSLFEESFHLYQKLNSNYTLSEWEASLLNKEIEAKYAVYISDTTHSGYGPEFKIADYTKGGGRFDIALINGFIDHQGVMLPNEHQEVFGDFMTLNVVPQMRKAKYELPKYQFNGNILPTDNFTNLHTLLNSQNP